MGCIVSRRKKKMHLLSTKPTDMKGEIGRS